MPRILPRAFLLLTVFGAVHCAWNRHLSISKPGPGQGAGVTVHWKGTPGNAQDWVAVVPKGASEREWGRWTYLGGRSSGSFQVSGLSPGAYEARLYLDWPKGGYTVVERVAFRVE